MTAGRREFPEGHPCWFKPVHTANVVANARWLWEKEGLSARKIGEAMGLSKDVIIGIAHRNNFPARPSPIKR